MRRESGAVAVNVDEVFNRWDAFKNKRASQVEDKAVIDYLKKILRIEQLVHNMTRYIMYHTSNICDLMETEI